MLAYPMQVKNLTHYTFLPTIVFMKEFNIGDSDFKNLIENNNYYIDKTLFIKEVIKTQKQVLLIPRPRRFGNTMNIKMLKYYFEKDKPEYAKLFNGLNIEKAEKDVLDRHGKYPVIFLSFKDVKEITWENTIVHLKAEIIRIFKKHSYLLDRFTDIEKNEYIEILNEKANIVKYENSLKNLSEYLYHYHKEKVVIIRYAHPNQLYQWILARCNFC